jgi:2-amino-4-hydroxy-6-hydroxymethyldihydropteridine diphosphokinase
MRNIKHQTCLLLGSNIEPEVNIPQAVSLLQEKLTILRVSSVWQSASVDCCYPDYLNLAVLVSTDLDAEQLKEQVLRPLETRMGRVRTEDRNASRTIDIDIILFDGQVIDPGLWQHVHQAMPVSEIYPGCRDERGRILRETARSLAMSTPIQLRQDVAIHFSPRKLNNQSFS